MVFGPVWTVLYVSIGTAGWLVWRCGQYWPVRHLLRRWGWQLGLNAVWAPAFFGLHSPLLGLAVILLLAAALGWTIAGFARLRPLAAWLLLPYAGWVAYAAYLDAGLCWLNR
jgi:tryptophan-rich sensory protein